MLLTPGNSWFAIGPVAVFAVAHTEPRFASAGLLLIALAAQFAVDFSISTLRFAEARGAGLVAQLRESWVYLIDIALTGMGLVVAVQVHDHPFVALAPLPLLGLLAWFAGERRQRLVSLLQLNSAYRGTALGWETCGGRRRLHRGPLQGVLGLALAVAEELKLNGEQRRTSNSGPCCTTSARSRSPRRSSTSPASSTRTSGS